MVRCGSQCVCVCVCGVFGVCSGLCVCVYWCAVFGICCGVSECVCIGVLCLEGVVVCVCVCVVVCMCVLVCCVCVVMGESMCCLGILVLSCGTRCSTEHERGVASPRLSRHVRCSSMSCSVRENK